MWILGLLVFLPLLTAGLLFFIQGDKLRDAVVKVSAAAIAMLSLFVAFTYFGNKVVFRLGDSFLAQGAILVDILVALDRKSTRLNSSHSRKSRMPSSA